MIYKEIMDGEETKHEGIYCNITHHPKGFLKRGVLYLCLSLGIDTKKEMIEVTQSVSILLAE